ncbi:MAG: hypothetical protein AB7U83_07825 [Vicinamibacterales bacterium]
MRRPSTRWLRSGRSESKGYRAPARGAASSRSSATPRRPLEAPQAVDGKIITLRDLDHVTSLGATHQIRDAFDIATLRDGRIQFTGTAEELLASEDPCVKAYLVNTAALGVRRSHGCALAAFHPDIVSTFRKVSTKPGQAQADTVRPQETDWLHVGVGIVSMDGRLSRRAVTA